MTRTAPLAAALAVCLLGLGCDSEPGSDCVGEESGDLVVSQGGNLALPGGGDVGIGSTRLDDDPPTVNLGLGGATEAERQQAVDMQVGDTFSVQDTTYTLVGACDDTVWLDEG